MAFSVIGNIFRVFQAHGLKPGGSVAKAVQGKSSKGFMARSVRGRVPGGGLAAAKVENDDQKRPAKHRSILGKGR